MIEIVGNLWEAECDWLCVTTNGIARNDGRAVMGRGVALQAKQRYPNIDVVLAEKLKKRGNHVTWIWRDGNKWIFSFPTKNHWRDRSDMALIERSAQELHMNFSLAPTKPIIVVPRPGCSNGGLKWEKVKSLLVPIWPEDNFRVIHDE